jgi:16S rRNA (guanine(527)-N(7))-methyltransferase RsmG
VKQSDSSIDVPRETQEKLQAYLALLIRWNARINLVADADADTLWRRHILDSIQLVPLLPPGDGPVIDLGSGAGLPGLIVAAASQRQIHLVESDRRKCAFLREAARLLDLPQVRIHNARIDAVVLPPAAVLTARALAPLPVLLAHAQRMLAPDGVALFPKGRMAEAELTAAAPGWTMRIERFPSRTDPESTILRLSEIRPVSASA